MRVIDLICPGCGAPLSSYEDRKYIFCSYCGRQIFLEDKAKATGSDTDEQQRRQYGPNMELAEKLRKARDQLSQCEELERQIEATQSALSSAQKGGLGMARLWIGIIIICGILCLINGGLAILGLFFGIILLIFIHKCKKQKKEQAVAEAQQRLSELYLQKETQHVDSGIHLQEKYRTSGALDTLYEFVINERAYTLQQAINLFEDRAQQLRMEKLSRDQLAAQQRQNELLEQQNRQWEEQQNERDRDDGFTLGKALLIGGLTIQAIRFFRKR